MATLSLVVTSPLREMGVVCPVVVGTAYYFCSGQHLQLFCFCLTIGM